MVGRFGASVMPGAAALAQKAKPEVVPADNGGDPDSRRHDSLVFAISKPLFARRCLPYVLRVTSGEKFGRGRKIARPFFWKHLAQPYFFEFYLCKIEESHWPSDEGQRIPVFAENAEAKHHQERTQVQWIAR